MSQQISSAADGFLASKVSGNLEGCKECNFPLEYFLDLFQTIRREKINV